MNCSLICGERSKLNKKIIPKKCFLILFDKEQTMKLSWLVPSALILSASIQAAEVTGTVSFTNDYRLRGISQSAGEPAIQGSLDVAFDNGVYAGLWGSNVDFEGYYNHTLELDPFVGYYGEINDSLSYDATLTYYTYHGDDSAAADVDFYEVIGNLYYGDVQLQYVYSDDVFNTNEDEHYLAIDYSLALSEQVNLDLHAGHMTGDYWKELDIGSYNDFTVGVSGNFAGLDLSAAYLFNDIDDGMDIDSGTLRNDDTLLLSVSRTF